MATLDWVFASVLVASTMVGAWRGLVFELMSLLGWVFAWFAARWFAVDAGHWLPIDTADETIRFVTGFAVVFIAALFAWGVVSWLARRLVEAVGVRPVDRALGAVFGLARGLLLLLVAAAVVQGMAWEATPWWRASQGAPLLARGLEQLKPALPEGWGRHLPSPPSSSLSL
ncbi:CvpA family protein [Xylophilus sp.]|uniref:CvpA family protein n=1 Tax=Xylophilus sp. TaxID=2653893 RepID=UPI0013BCA8D8|nr:CvpA family protein [Xylophilus sp.]KAF1049493.1 MAG: Colicin V production protein [Xylophilus sp.]